MRILNKLILEAGFTKAFKKLYEDYTTSLDDRINKLEEYTEIMGELPEADLTFDAHCEIEKWTEENKATLKPFFYIPFFESTCPVPYPEENPNDPAKDADMDFSVVSEASNDINSNSHNYIVKFLIKDFDDQQSYKIKYSINGTEQDLLTIGSGGSTTIAVPQEPGAYTYKFIEILNSDGAKSIKEVNRIKSITIGDGGVLEKLSTIDEALQGPAADYPDSITKEPRKIIPELTEDQIIERLIIRVLSQNDNSKNFFRFIENITGSNLLNKVRSKIIKIVENERERLNDLREAAENKIQKRLDRAVGSSQKKVLKKKLQELKKENKKEKDRLSKRVPILPGFDPDPINKYIFQEEHSDMPDDIPEYINKNSIIRVTYVSYLDKYTDNAAVNRAVTRAKENLYDKEKERWRETQRKWARHLEEINKEEQEEDGENPYMIMASAIIKYWQSSATQPFSKSPPVPPCNTQPPLTGIYAPVYYGSKTLLANDLRRAWNNGKIFSVQPANPVASKLVASGVALACAKHLLLLKFLYLGGITTPVSPIPMIGFVPVAF